MCVTVKEGVGVSVSVKSVSFRECVHSAIGSLVEIRFPIVSSFLSIISIIFSHSPPPFLLLRLHLHLFLVLFRVPISLSSLLISGSFSHPLRHHHLLHCITSNALGSPSLHFLQSNLRFSNRRATHSGPLCTASAFRHRPTSFGPSIHPICHDPRHLFDVISLAERLVHSALPIKLPLRLALVATLLLLLR